MNIVYKSPPYLGIAFSWRITSILFFFAASVKHHDLQLLMKEFILAWDSGERPQWQGTGHSSRGLSRKPRGSHPPHEHKAESEPPVEGGCELKSSPVKDFFQQGCTS